MQDENNSSDMIELATELTIAWLNNANNRVVADEVPSFLQKMHRTLLELSQPGELESNVVASTNQHTPAVTARKSLSSPDHIISMIDGRPYKTLRRHLKNHGLSPEEYRTRYNLKGDYPMVAPAYSEVRRAMAHKIGLGNKGKNARAAAAAPAAKPGRRPRKGPAEAGNSES